MAGFPSKTRCATYRARYLSKSVNVRVETDHLLLAYHVTNIFSELNHSVTI